MTPTDHRSPATWWLGCLISRLSLRTRVLLIAIALLAVGLLVGSIVVTELLRDHLVGRVNDQLRTQAENAARPSRAVRLQIASTASRGATWVDYAAALGPDGDVVWEHRADDRSDSTDPVLPHLDRATVEAHDGKIFDATSDDASHHWRVIALPMEPNLALSLGASAAPEQGSVVMAAPLDEVDATIGQLRTISLMTGGALLAVLTVTGWFAVHAGLRPLRQIEETSAAVANGEFSRRVPDLAVPSTEIGRLAAAFNGMLSRNEAAFAAQARSQAQMRRFVADASHELRTPLAGIRGFTKLYRMGGLAEPTDIADTMARIEKESERLTRLVEDLLLLARLDEHEGETGSLCLAPMDLRTLAADALHNVRALDPSRHVTLTGPDGDAPGAAPTAADEARMRQVVTNLIGNAVTHTPRGTPIRIGVGSVDGCAVLEVSDQGPGLTAEQARRVFDRFFRVDNSRSRRTGGGAGLGLAIAQSLVTAHGGTLRLTTTPGQGATFTVVLPVLETYPPEA